MSAGGNGASTSPCKGEVDRAAGGRGSASRFSRTKSMTAKARGLRQKPTDAELALWKALRRGQLREAAFRRQHPIGRYVLDFYCAACRLAIEVDGGQHASKDARRSDRVRSHWLTSNGVCVLRFWNNEVLSNLQGVLEVIALKIDALALTYEKTPSRREARADLPLSGGGEGTAVVLESDT